MLLVNANEYEEKSITVSKSDAFSISLSPSLWVLLRSRFSEGKSTHLFIYLLVTNEWQSIKAKQKSKWFLVPH